MKRFQRLLCVLLTFATLSATAALSADDGAKVTVSKVQRLTVGTAFDPDTAPEASGLSAGDIVVLTIAFRNDTAAAVQVSGFSVKLLYDRAKAAPYHGDAPFEEDSYLVSPQLAQRYNWIQAGNDQRSFTLVNAAGTRTYSVAPGATLTLAYMAFQLNADAEFTFDAKKTYLSVMDGGKRKTLRPDASSFRLTLAGEYAITAVNSDSVTLTNPSHATLALAYFDADGTFRSAAMQSVPANAGTVPVTFASAPRVSVMLLGDDCRPLCVYG